MKKTTPFKAPSDFEQELTEFSNKYKVLLADHSKRISDYFEMTCYNFVILHIPADTRSAFPVISVQSPVSIQCCWQS